MSVREVACALKYGRTRKNTQRCYKPKRLIRYIHPKKNTKEIIK